MLPESKESIISDDGSRSVANFSAYARNLDAVFVHQLVFAWQKVDVGSAVPVSGCEWDHDTYIVAAIGAVVPYFVHCACALQID